MTENQTIRLVRFIPILLGWAFIASADAGFDEAATAFSAGNYSEAITTLRPLANHGDARSQYAMGVMSEKGFGMPVNLRQAADWYQKAAKQGNADAQYNLGAMYEHGIGMPVDYVQAVRWYRPAAESGDIDALSNLGVLYQKGQGVSQDQVLALALYNVSVALDTNANSQAARNRQGLANAMTLPMIQEATELTKKLLQPGRLQAELKLCWSKR